MTSGGKSVILEKPENTGFIKITKNTEKHEINHGRIISNSQSAANKHGFTGFVSFDTFEPVWPKG